MALSARAAQRAFVLPEGNAPQAALADGARILPARTLLEVVAHLAGEAPLEPYSGEARCSVGTYADFSEVKGRQQAKRALEVAAAGGHSVLMVGPPGTGKSMLAARFPGILPRAFRGGGARNRRDPLGVGERFRGVRWGERRTARRITALLRQRSSAAACCRARGRSRSPTTACCSSTSCRSSTVTYWKALREPLETGRVSIARAARQAQFPARFQLVAAMNPCPCGHCGDRSGRCRCTPERIARYRGRVSGPLADRIDIKLEVPAAARERAGRAGGGRGHNLNKTEGRSRTPCPTRSPGQAECAARHARDRQPLRDRPRRRSATSSRARAPASLGTRISPRVARCTHHRRSCAKELDRCRPHRRSDPIPPARRKLLRRAAPAL